MAYTEPGIKVVQEIQSDTVVVQSADQDPVIVGEHYEVFTDQPSTLPYNGLTGAGAQVYTWPSKKLTSIVDLSGIRGDSAEPDSQLLASAVYPMSVELQDPVTLVKTSLNLLTDVEAVSQAGFTITEGVAAAVARAAGTNGTSAEAGILRLRTGGFVTAGVKVGDSIRVVLQNPSSTTISGVVTLVTDSEIRYTSSTPVVADGINQEGLDGDAVSIAGKLISVAGGFNSVENGDRIALWPEASQHEDANGTSASAVTSPTFSLTDADIGRYVTIGSARPADGAVTASNGVTNGTNTVTGTGITASMVGRVVRLSGGTPALPATYRRIITASSGTMTVSGGVISARTGVVFTIYAAITRVIEDVPTPNEFSYSGASIDDLLQVGIPVIFHSKVLRDVTSVDSDNELTYSGAALTSATGFLTRIPFQNYRATVVFQVMPTYRVLVSYRALDTSLLQGVRVTTAQAIAALGNNGKFNPLLFAARLAILAMGTTDRNLLLVGVNPWGHQSTPTGLPQDRDELAAYNEALTLLSSDEQVYFQAPLTMNTAVQAGFVSNLNANSDPDVKQERTVALTFPLPLGVVQSTTGRIEPGLDGGNKLILDNKGFITNFSVIPGTTVVITSPPALAGTRLTDADTNNTELDLQGANWPITQEFSASDATFSIFDGTQGRVTSATANIWKDVDVGDWIVSSGQYRRVSSKINNQTLGYSGGLLVGTGVTVAIIRSTVISYHVKPLSKAEQALALKAAPAAFSNRRVVPIWPDVAEVITGTDEAGLPVKEFVPSYYLAAVAMAQMAVMPIQNSTTGHPIPGFTDLNHSNRYFDRTQLNVIAEGGFTIYTQPVRGGAIVCRHLQTSDTSNEKTVEFSFTKNVDNQAKVLRASLSPLLSDPVKGRKNVTQPLLDSLMLPIQGVLDFFYDLGQIVDGAGGEQPYVIVSLKQDPLSLRKIVLRVRTTQPLPANQLEIEYVI